MARVILSGCGKVLIHDDFSYIKRIKQGEMPYIGDPHLIQETWSGFSNLSRKTGG